MLIVDNKSNKKYRNLFHLLTVTTLIVISDDSLILAQILIKIHYHKILVNNVIRCNTFYISYKKYAIKKILTFSGIMILSILFTMVLNVDIRLGYFYRIILILISVLIVNYISIESFFYQFNKIITIIAGASVIGHFFSVFRIGIVEHFPTVVNTSGMSFYNLFIVVIPKIYYYSSIMVRNFGLFREPGVYQMYIILALIIQLFIFSKPNLKITIMYILVLISTFSTTGYIALLLLLGTYMVKRNKNRNDAIKKMLIVIFGTAIFVYLLLFTDLLFSSGYGSVFGKLTNLTRGTTSARVASVIVNIKLFLTSPVWGVGLSSLDEQFSSLAMSILDAVVVDNTNTVLIQFSVYGLVFGSLWTY